MGDIMRGLEHFEQLVAESQGAVAPPVDVATQVLVTLRTQEAPACNYMPVMMATSGLSLLIAVLMAAFTFQAWDVLQDPLTSLFVQSIDWVME